MPVITLPFPRSSENAAFLKALDRLSEIFKARGIDLITVDCDYTDENLADKVKLLLSSDGLIFPGNPFSIDPAQYGEQSLHVERMDPNPKNFLLVKALINKARNSGMPVLGICAGAWYLNVAAGGNLKQEIPASETIHDADPRDGKVVHSINIKPDTLLANLIGTTPIGVNSWHDQAIGDRLGDGLEVDAIAPNGTIEAISGIREPFFLGLQFHLEYLLPGEGAGHLSEKEIARQHRVFDAFAQVVNQFHARRLVWNIPAEMPSESLVLFKTQTVALVDAYRSRKGVEIEEVSCD